MNSLQDSRNVHEEHGSWNQEVRLSSILIGSFECRHKVPDRCKSQADISYDYDYDIHILDDLSSIAQFRVKKIGWRALPVKPCIETDRAQFQRSLNEMNGVLAIALASFLQLPTKTLWIVHLTIIAEMA
jgi:hypothetical protein